MFPEGQSTSVAGHSCGRLPAVVHWSAGSNEEELAVEGRCFLKQWHQVHRDALDIAEDGLTRRQNQGDDWSRWNCGTVAGNRRLVSGVPPEVE